MLMIENRPLCNSCLLVVEFSQNRRILVRIRLPTDILIPAALVLNRRPVQISI